MFCLHAQVPKVNGIEFKFDDLMDKLDANYNRKSNDSSKLSASFIVGEPNLYCLRILITRSVTQRCDVPRPPFLYGHINCGTTSSLALYLSGLKKIVLAIL